MTSWGPHEKSYTLNSINCKLKYNTELGYYYLKWSNNKKTVDCFTPDLVVSGTENYGIAHAPTIQLQCDYYRVFQLRSSKLHLVSLPTTTTSFLIAPGRRPFHNEVLEHVHVVRKCDWLPEVKAIIADLYITLCLQNNWLQLLANVITGSNINPTGTIQAPDLAPHRYELSKNRTDIIIQPVN